MQEESSYDSVYIPQGDIYVDPHLYSIYLQHEFILLGKESHRAKHQLEQLQVEVRLLHVLSHCGHPWRGRAGSK